MWELFIVIAVSAAIVFGSILLGVDAWKNSQMGDDEWEL